MRDTPGCARRPRINIDAGIHWLFISLAENDGSATGNRREIAMRLLTHCNLGTKLGLLVGLFTFIGVMSGIVMPNVIYQRMVDDRADKLAAVVTTAVGLADSLEKQAARQQIPETEAV